MKLLRNWRILLAFGLVFGAGAVTGVVATHLAFKRAFEKGFTSAGFTANIMNELQRKLDLTPEQQPKARAIVEDMAREFKTAFGKTIQESAGILARAGRRLDAEFTPEQQAIHQQMRVEFRDALRKHLNIDLPEE
jgi:hypothetical protein